MRKLFKILTVIIPLSICHQMSAQNMDFTQYFLNPVNINPGFAGAEDYLDIKMGFRQGWNDFSMKNNNLYFSAHGVLNKSRRLLVRNNSLRISTPSLYKEAESEKKMRRKHGLGGIITSRTFGPFRQLAVNTNYAYHIPLSAKFNLALGTRLSYVNQRINFLGFTVRDDVNDLFYQQLIRANQGNENVVAIDFGSVLYTNNFYFGISTINMASKMISGDNLLSEKVDKRLSLQTGLCIPLGSNFGISPGVQLTHSETYDISWASNLRLRYKELLYLGGGFSSEKKLSILLGLSLSERLCINYSYDQYLSELSDFNVTMHELVIGAYLFRGYDVKTKFW